jgi:hypothetical protein
VGIAHISVASHSCTFEVWDGDIDEVEVHAHLFRLAEDPAWPPGVLNLVDLTTVGSVSIPDPELVALLREGTLLEKKLKTALVVRPELLDTNAPRYDEAARATGVRVFGDLGAASDHLGIPVEASVEFVEGLRQSP